MPDRPSHRRRYADLTPSEKARVRKMYAAGDAIMAIAQRLRVYGGTMTTAAGHGAWTRPKGRLTIAQRIVSALGEHPSASDAEVAALVGCHPGYVRDVRAQMLRR